MYIYYDDLKKISFTDREEKAVQFKTSAKAYNVLNCALPKKKRVGWQVIEQSDTDKTNKTKKNSSPIVSVQLTDDGVQRYRSDTKSNDITGIRPEWNSIIKNFQQAYSDIIQYKDEIYEQLQDVEAELCDCEHACEFFKFNASRGYKLYSMIHERRNKRRYLKNEYRKSMAVLNMSYQHIADGKLGQLFKEIDEQSYEPRALKGLFNI